MTNAELKDTMVRLAGLNFDDVFLADFWTLDDINNALELLGITDEINGDILKLLKADSEAMQERMTQAGWDYMYSAITEHLRREWVVQFTNKSGGYDETTFSTRDVADPEALDEVLNLINEQWDELEIESVESISKGNLEIV